MLFHLHGAYSQVVLSFVFFFQAEDGIRDLTVTGVQTCALPISVSRIWFKASFPCGRLKAETSKSECATRSIPKLLLGAPSDAATGVTRSSRQIGRAHV